MAVNAIVIIGAIINDGIATDSSNGSYALSNADAAAVGSSSVNSQFSTERCVG